MTQLSDDPVHAIPATRAIRRSRGRWRMFAFLALGLAAIIGIVRFGPELTVPRDAVARIEILGTITTNRERLERIEALAEDGSVRAVIVAINSPGGTTAGGEELYEALRDLSQRKPTVAIINELGASAAYMTAMGTDHIFARRLSIVGSIGVLYRHVDAGRLLQTIGIDLDKIASGELKAEPEFDAPISPEVRESLAALVEDSFSWFVDLVAERRELTRSRTLALADGRIMTGQMGVEAGLIDALGGEEQARQWLSDTHGVDPGLKAFTAWPPPSRTGWLGQWLAQSAADALGLGAGNAIALDGLVSLWHPSP
jgi:protease-4